MYAPTNRHLDPDAETYSLPRSPLVSLTVTNPSKDNQSHSPDSS